MGEGLRTSKREGRGLGRPPRWLPCGEIPDGPDPKYGLHPKKLPKP